MEENGFPTPRSRRIDHSSKHRPAYVERNRDNSLCHRRSGSHDSARSSRAIVAYSPRLPPSRCS